MRVSLGLVATFGSFAESPARMVGVNQWSTLSGELLGGGRHADVVLGPVALPNGRVICDFGAEGRHKAERSLDSLVRVDDSLHHTARLVRVAVSNLKAKQGAPLSYILPHIRACYIEMES